MKASLFLVALLALGAFAYTEEEYRTSFTVFMRTHQKAYSHEEFQLRYRTFRANMDMIAAHNARSEVTYKLAMNSFGDLSQAEFAKIFTSGLLNAAGMNSDDVISASAEALPASFDWRTKGAVTAIKNQGQCGSCWSFSTTGSVEGCHFLGTGSLVSLSEQNLMDCSTSQGNMGCNGGLMTQAMEYIISNGGIDTESSYPYTAADGSCHYSAANKGSTLTSYSNVASGDEGALQTSVSQGPTSVAIDASNASFQFYSSGVYNEPACSSSQLDHGVLAVGWGTDSSSGSDYWIVKNSWGTGWGQQGYIWMSRNKNNQCGIATMATLPKGCN